MNKHFNNLASDLVKSIDEEMSEASHAVTEISAERAYAPTEHYFNHLNGKLEALQDLLIPALNKFKIQVLAAQNVYLEDCAMQDFINSSVSDKGVHWSEDESVCAEKEPVDPEPEPKEWTRGEDE